jgi:hypothetical protein
MPHQLVRKLPASSHPSPAPPTRCEATHNLNYFTSACLHARRSSRRNKARDLKLNRR